MFAFSCKVNTIPVQAGAEALQWATSIAVKYNLVNVVIESDYRTCIQGLSTSCASIPWHITNILLENKALAHSVHSFSFSWVPRRANKTAHELGQWSLCNRAFGFFGSKGEFVSMENRIGKLFYTIMHV